MWFGRWGLDERRKKYHSTARRSVRLELRETVATQELVDFLEAIVQLQSSKQLLDHQQPSQVAKPIELHVQVVEVAFMILADQRALNDQHHNILLGVNKRDSVLEDTLHVYHNRYRAGVPVTEKAAQK